MEISDSDKQEYFRSILGQRAFTKTAKLLDGGYTITFITLDVFELKALNALETLHAADPDLVDMLRIRAYCVDLNGKTLRDFSNVPEEDLVVEATELFGKLPSGFFGVVRETYNKFIETLDALTDLSVDPAF